MRKHRIFITEDERLVAISLQRKLTGLGYEVVGIAASGQETLDKVAKTTPDLILMDIQLKGNFDGIETAAYLRTNFDIPIIYLTAYDDDATLQRAKITEPFGYLLKPYQARDLRTTIEMALYKHSLEQKLKEKEQWSKATLNSIGEGVITTDIHGKVTFMNRAAEHLTQWRPTQAFGEDIATVLRLTKEKMEPAALSDLMVPADTEPSINLEHTTFLITKQGRKIPVSHSNAPIIDDQGMTNGGVLVFRDITQQRQLEAKLHQSKKLEALGQLAEGIAHHFNNLLTSIIGYVTFAQETIAEDHQAKEDLARVLEASEHAASLTQQLLMFTRQNRMQLQEIDFNILVEYIDHSLTHSIEKTIIHNLILAPNVGEVKLDTDQFEQLLDHLIVNACEAMPNGGHLTIETQRVLVPSSRSGQSGDIPPGEYALLAVTDTGTGMTTEVQSHLFEPFFTTKPVGQGTGLGLATCLGIVKQHQGHIRIQSQFNKGTRIEVYFPCLPC
ncbi:MAG: response regulator [Anaerolineae bacterium]|nr:response regulator [Anaerolineae bacterium]